MNIYIGHQLTTWLLSEKIRLLFLSFSYWIMLWKTSQPLPSSCLNIRNYFTIGAASFAGSSGRVGTTL